MKLSKILSFLLSVMLAGSAFGQTGVPGAPSNPGPMYAPNWYQGYVPTPYEWQTMWSNKISYFATGIPIQFGGTGATNAAAARANLGVVGTGLNSGQIYVGNASNIAAAVNPTGDLTISNAGIFTVTKTNGNLFTYFATGTDASHLTGTVPVGTLPIFDSTHNGVVTASGGGSSNFLRADGTWQAPPGFGTVTSVGMTVPGIMAVGGSPVTGAGTLAVTLQNQNPNLVWAGPTSGGGAAPTFRSLVAADIPGSLPYVTSVGLTLPVSMFTVSGSPVTGSGTLSATFANQSANTFFAGPSSGGATTPMFRNIAFNDLPSAGVVYAQQYATCDGSTDDNIALQTAINNTPFGGTLIAPSSTQCTFGPDTSSVAITIASPGVVTWNGHGLTAGVQLNFSTTGALPTGLAAATTYYVVNPTTNTFQVSATLGGSAINTTGSQSGTQTATNMTYALAIRKPITILVGQGGGFSPLSTVTNTTALLYFYGHTSNYAQTMINGLFLGNNGSGTRYGGDAVVFDTTAVGPVYFPHPVIKNTRFQQSAGVSSTVTVSIASPGVVTWTNHNLTAGATVVFSTTGALPTGLAAGVTYFVINPTATTFQLTASSGGTPIVTSGSQSGTQTAQNYGQAVRIINSETNNPDGGTSRGVFGPGNQWYGGFSVIKGGDSIGLFANIIQGNQAPSVYVDLVNGGAGGAGNFYLIGNNLGNQGGALVVAYAQSIQVTSNEFEQGVTSTELYNSLVDFTGTSAAIGQVVFTGNQMQANGGIGNPVLIRVGNVSSAVIDNNKIATPAAYTPVVITASANNVLMGLGNYFTGGGTSISDSSATTIYPIPKNGDIGGASGLSLALSGSTAHLSVIDNSTSNSPDKLFISSGQTGTTAGSNVVARFATQATGRDTSILLSDTITNSIKIGMLNGYFFVQSNGSSILNIDPAGNLSTSTWNGSPIANAYLANSATTVNGQTCTLGSTCTVAASASTLTGTLVASAFPALTGDITTTAGSLATILASVATGATTGSSTAIPVVTFNNKGLVTAITTAAVIAPAGTLSGGTLASGVTASSLTSFGASAVLVTPTITQVNSASSAVDMVLNVGNAGQEFVVARTGTAFIRGNPFNFYPTGSTNLGQAGNPWAAAWITLPNTATTSAVCVNVSTWALSYDSTIGTCTLSPLWMKNPIGPVPTAGIDALYAVRTEAWTYKDEFIKSGAADARVHVGLYADDVEKMDKRCVGYKDGKLQDYDTRCVLAYAIAAMKNLKIANDNLAAQVETLKRAVK